MDALAQDREVELVVVGSPQEAGAVRSAIGQHGFAGASTRFDRADRVLASNLLIASDQRTLARCFVDLRRLPQVRLYFADAEAQHFLVRDLELEHGLDELGREELAQVLESSFEALLDPSAGTLSRAEVSSVLEPAPQPKPLPIPRSPPPPTAPRAPTHYWSVGASYRGEVGGPGVLTHGPVADLRFEVHPQRLGYVAWARAAYFIPNTRRARPIGVELQGVGWRLGLGLAIPLSQSVTVIPGLGAGADFVHLAPFSTTDEAALTPARFATYAVLTGLLDARIKLSSNLFIAASFGVDADLRPRRYYVETDSAEHDVFQPWRVRPALGLGVGCIW
jgi:hypothetical protein